MPAHGLHVPWLGLLQALPARIDHVLHHGSDHAADGLVNETPLVATRMVSGRVIENRAHERDVPHVGDGEEAGAQPVVHVVVVVGDIVRQRRDLGLWAGMGVEFQVVPGRIRLDVAGYRIRREWAIVLRHPFQGLPGQVQAVEAVIAVLQGRQDAHGLGVVVEAAVGRHRLIERRLPGVAEGRMPEIVGQRKRLGEVFVHTEDAADRARDLRDLQAVGQPGAVVIPLVIDEDLGLVLQTPKRRAVDDPVAVALKGRPGAAFRLRIEAPAALLGV